MPFFYKELEFQTKGNKATFFEIRQLCRDFVADSGVKDGILVIQSQHTTCGVFFEEMDHDTNQMDDYFLNVDLCEGLNKIFPKETQMNSNYIYPGPKHIEFAKSRPNSAFNENHSTLLNGDAHLKSTLVGSDCTFVIKDGEIQTGNVGYIYFVDFDGNRPRKRSCHLAILSF